MKDGIWGRRKSRPVWNMGNQREGFAESQPHRKHYGGVNIPHLCILSLVGSRSLIAIQVRKACLGIDSLNQTT